MTRPLRVWSWQNRLGAGLVVLNTGMIAQSIVVEHSTEWGTAHAVFAILMAVMVNASVQSRRRLRALQQQELNEAIDRGEQ